MQVQGQALQPINLRGVIWNKLRSLNIQCYSTLIDNISNRLEQCRHPSWVLNRAKAIAINKDNEQLLQISPTNIKRNKNIQPMFFTQHKNLKIHSARIQK